MTTELAPALLAYGFPGAVVLVASLLLWKLLDRGFTFQVPPKRGAK
jgi:hypothetical protein